MVELDPITINNPYGEAWRSCKMGAREMMIRELVMNAVEACRDKPEGERLIRVYGTRTHGFPAEKLAIWNRGGMNRKTLRQFSNINAAINKTNAIDENFGRGAKIASIMSNTLGVRFRSCYDGRVLEVTLAADPQREMVGRIETPDALEGTRFIRDVTSEYQGATEFDDDFRTLATDWTEVTLMGNEPEQDTTREPYLGASLPESLWLWSAIGMRFFDLPKQVDLKVRSTITRHKGSGGNQGRPYWLNFKPMRESISDIPHRGQYDCIPFNGGRIHYILPEAPGKVALPRAPRFGTEYYNRPFGGIVWRNEIHNLHSGTGRAQATLSSKPWPPLALRWGLVRSYNQVSILVEIDDDAATNDINRTFLIGRDGLQIEPEQFADLVRENMPDWVVALEQALEPKEDEALRNIREYLRSLMREFQNRTLGLALGGDEASAERVEGKEGDGEWHGGKTPKTSTSLEEANDTLNAKRRQRLMEAPLVKWEDDQWFRDQGFDGMGAHYETATATTPGTIFFNQDHLLFHRLVQAIKERLPEISEPELANDVARRAAKSVCYLAVGTHVVAGLSLLQSGVEEQAVKNALDELVMTTAMATTRFSKHFVDGVNEAKRDLRTRLLGATQEVA